VRRSGEDRVWRRRLNISELHDDIELAATAKRIREAYDRALLDGCKTGDLGGSVNTKQFTQAVIDRL